jgi:hypothetical protein
MISINKDGKKEETNTEINMLLTITQIWSSFSPLIVYEKVATAMALFLCEYVGVARGSERPPPPTGCCGV